MGQFCRTTQRADQAGRGHHGQPCHRGIAVGCGTGGARALTGAHRASTHHSNSALLCDEGREYQTTIDEHRHRGVFFGDARQMVGGSTNKLTAAGFDQADKKASTFNAAKFYLVGNRSTGTNMFGRNKKF
jgi:hypothetical protein